MTTHPLPEFKPEDFSSGHKAYNQPGPGVTYVSPLIRAAEDAANAKLRAWRDGLPKLHSNSGCPDKFWGSTLDNKDTHTARIFDIEEIKPKECKHKTIYQPTIDEYCCSACGKRLKPNWTAVE